MNDSTINEKDIDVGRAHLGEARIHMVLSELCTYEMVSIVQRPAMAPAGRTLIHVASIYNDIDVGRACTTRAKSRSNPPFFPFG
jgi:hypothetical protein